MPNWFYIDANGQKQGPVSDSQLKTLAAQGIIQPDSPLATDTGKKGTAGQIRGLFPVASSAPAPPVEKDPWDWGIPASEVTSLVAESQTSSASPPPKPAASSRQRQRRSGGSINTYLVWSIITTLCCMPLLGIPAIIFSVLCGSDLKAGQYDSAAMKSSIAFWCNVIGLTLWVLLLIIQIALLLPAIQAAREAATLAANAQNARSNPEPYLERRANFKTKLTKTGKAPQEWGNEPLPPGVEKVKYPSDNLQLDACLYVPQGRREQKNPALVFFHGGFAHDNEDILACDIFMKAGFVVLAPALRAESGGPGNFELFLGEVDDAANAVRWLAQQSYVDTERIYTFGHSVGGGISCLLSLMDNVPIKHGGSSGGLYNSLIISAWKSEGYAPFNPRTTAEMEMRLLLGNIRWMKRPHYVYLGTADNLFDISVELAQAEMQNESINNMLFIQRIPGDHFTSFDPAIRAYFQKVSMDRDMRGGRLDPQDAMSMVRNFRERDPLGPQDESGQTAGQRTAQGAAGQTPAPPMVRSPADMQDQTRRRSARMSLRSLANNVERYYRDTGQYPTTAQGFNALISRPAILPSSANWRGPYLIPSTQERSTTDPWGNKYQYSRPGKSGRPFDIWSLGPDGKDGTADDVGHWMEASDL